MPRQIAELASRYRRLDTSKGDQVAGVLEGAQIVAQALGVELPNGFGSPTVGRTILEDVSLQAQRYVDRGFPEAIGMSVGQFTDVVCSLVPPSGFQMEFKDRFPIPTVRISGINLDTAYGLTGIRNASDAYGDRRYFPLGSNKDVAIDLIWMNDGGINLNKPITEVLSTLAPDERPATVADGFGLLLARPELLAFHHVYLPGSMSAEEDKNRLYKTVASLTSRSHDGSAPMLIWDMVGQVGGRDGKEDFTANPGIGSATVRKTPREPKTT